MGFQPDHDYETVISGVSQCEDNDGNPEIHLFCGDNESSITFKLKWKLKPEVLRSRDVLVSLGVDVTRMATSEAYVGSLPAMLTGRIVFIRTKSWEMNGRIGVYVKQLSPTPFEPISKAISGKMSRLLAGGEAAVAPVAVTKDAISDDDIPF